MEENKLLESGENINIATTDQNLSVDAMFQQAALPSLGRQIFSVQQMSGPTAALFNIKSDLDIAGKPKFKLLRKEVQVFEGQPISSGVTQEVVQDIKSQYGKDASTLIGNILRGVANTQENTKTLAFLESEALATTTLTISDYTMAEPIMFQVIQKVSELVLKMNAKNLRTYDSRVVLPYKLCAAVMGLSAYAGGEDDTDRGLLVSEIGNMRFYVNPDATSSTAYVVLKDKDMSKSSAVFSPYVSNVVESTNADTGETVYHIFNRFAITASPLHETGNEMIYKFTVV